MSNDALVVVFDAETEVDALLSRNLLEEAGIDVVERPLEAVEFEGVRQRALHSQLLVMPEDRVRAEELLASFAAEAESGELYAGLPAEDAGA